MGLVVRQAVRALQIAFDPVIKSFGDALPVFGLFQPLFIGGIGNKGYLGEHRRHVRADQNDKGSLSHAAVAVSVIDSFHALGKRVLNNSGKVAGLFDLIVLGDLLDDVLQIVDRVFRQSVFTGSDFHGVARPGEIQVIGLNAARVVILAGIGMDG